MTIYLETKPCLICMKPSLIEMTADQLERLQLGVELVQDIFPDWSPGQRELLISGTHNECWKKSFSEDEDWRDELEEDWPEPEQPFDMPIPPPPAKEF